MGKRRIKNICLSAILCAAVCICAAISIPLPIGVPITLQTFAIALLALCLPPCYAIFSYFAYLALGIVGLPVFSSLSGGIGVLFGPTGGFLWGFLIFLIISSAFKNKKGAFFIALFGLLLLYIAGSVQLSLVGNASFLSALLISLPFFPKDVLLVLAAFYVYKRIKPIIN